MWVATRFELGSTPGGRLKVSLLTSAVSVFLEHVLWLLLLVRLMYVICNGVVCVHACVCVCLNETHSTPNTVENESHCDFVKLREMLLR